MKFHGVSINSGVGSTIVGVNGLFQTREHGIKASSEQVTDGGDTTVSKVYWDFHETATFSYVANQNYANSGNAFVGYPSPSNWITVIDPIYPAIQGNWLVDDVSVASSNTTATKVTLVLSRYPHLN